MVHTASPIANREKMLRDRAWTCSSRPWTACSSCTERKALDFDEDVEIPCSTKPTRMVDMGQATDIRKLLAAAETRQTPLFSATMPGGAESPREGSAHRAVRVDLTSPQPSAGITHAIYRCPSTSRSSCSTGSSRSGEVRSTIVFTRQREGADCPRASSERLKYAVATLHER